MIDWLINWLINWGFLLLPVHCPAPPVSKTRSPRRLPWTWPTSSVNFTCPWRRGPRKALPRRRPSRPSRAPPRPRLPILPYLLPRKRWLPVSGPRRWSVSFSPWKCLNRSFYFLPLTACLCRYRLGTVVKQIFLHRVRFDCLKKILRQKKKTQRTGRASTFFSPR